MEKVKCSERVFDGWRHQGCSRNATVERNGKPYCGQHDPEAVTRRLPASTVKWQQQRDAETAKRQYEIAAVRACREAGLSAEDLEAGAIGRLVEAAGELLHHVTSQPGGNLCRMETLEGRVEWYEGLMPKRDNLREALSAFEKVEKGGKA